MRKRNNKIPWKERDELEQVFKNTLRAGVPRSEINDPKERE